MTEFETKGTHYQARFDAEMDAKERKVDEDTAQLHERWKREDRKFAIFYWGAVSVFVVPMMLAGVAEASGW